MLSRLRTSLHLHVAAVRYKCREVKAVRRSRARKRVHESSTTTLYIYLQREGGGGGVAQLFGIAERRTRLSN